MSIHGRCIAAAAVLLFSGGAAAWNVPMEKFEAIPIPGEQGVTLPLPQIREAMVNAAAGISARPWTMTELAPGKMVARLDAGRRRHVVVLDLSYSPTQYSLAYRSSSRMNYDADGTIHSSYNVWVRELVDHINLALSKAVSAAAREPRPAPQAIVAKSATAPAANAEVAFWESVRDSRDPAELQAYLQQYPGGTFAALARARLTALGHQPLAAAEPAAATVAMAQPAAAMTGAPRSESRYPAAGDTWTYRLSIPKQPLQSTPPPQTYVVKVRSASQSEIVDELSAESGSADTNRHSGGAYLMTQGVSVFSPYFYPFTEQAQPGTPLRRIEVRDAPCRSSYVCEAKGSIVGRESVDTAAGRFEAIKIVVQQSWRAASGAGRTGEMNGGRTIVIWYAPEVKRAVRYRSRLVAGDVPPVEGNFDIELVKYELN